MSESNSILTLLKNASRPFKTFTTKIGEQEFTFKTRNLSSIDADTLAQVFSREFDKVASDMESGGLDVSVIKRGLARQSKESLAKLVVRADKTEYLQEASSELDDKPFSDAKVKALAEEKESQAYKFLLDAPEDEVLDKAVERRAFVVSSIRATDMQNLHFLYYVLFSLDGERAFNSPEEVGELDRNTVVQLINEVYKALRGGSSATAPLKRQGRKPSAKHSTSPKPSVEE